MKRFKRLLVAVAVLSLAVPAFAKLSKYKDWSNSPEGYFMTKAERAQWSAIDTDEAAQAFVDKFIASRGGDAFVAETSKRAEMADKYLTVGKLPGSKTLRGKAIVLFGAPSAINVTGDSGAQVSRDNPAVNEAYRGAGAGGDSGGSDVKGGVSGNGSGLAESGGTFGAPMISTHVTRTYHLGFDAAPGGPVDFTFVADGSSGKDRVAKSSTNLDDAFERAAIASIKSK
jgi:GWxTD domain-containing protein